MWQSSLRIRHAVSRGLLTVRLSQANTSAVDVSASNLSCLQSSSAVQVGAPPTQRQGGMSEQRGAESEQHLSDQ